MGRLAVGSGLPETGHGDGDGHGDGLALRQATFVDLTLSRMSQTFERANVLTFKRRRRLEENWRISSKRWGANGA